MKRKKLGLIHTSATLVPVFAQLCKAKLPQVDMFNIVDDSLVKGIMAAGSLTPQIRRRVAGYLESAESGRRGLNPGDLFLDRPGGGGGGETDRRAGAAGGPADGGQGGANGKAHRRHRHAADDTRTDGGFDSTPGGRGRKEDRTHVPAVRRRVRRVDERRGGETRRDGRGGLEGIVAAGGRDCAGAGLDGAGGGRACLRRTNACRFWPARRIAVDYLATSACDTAVIEKPGANSAWGWPVSP